MLKNDVFILFPAIIDRNREQEEAAVAETLEPAGDQTQKVPKGLFCSVCLCIFQTPVMLQCGHSFCQSCVVQTWAGKVSRKCPLCEQVMAGAQPQINYSLKSLCETFTEEPPQVMEEESLFHPASLSFICPFPCSSFQIPPRNVVKKQGDFEKVVNVCSSSVELMKVSAPLLALS